MQDDDRKTPRPLITKDELNLVEYPFCLPSHRAPKGRTTIQISEEARDAEGRPTQRHWKVVGGYHGLPLAGDEEVYFALVHLLHMDGFADRTVHFTQYSLLKKLGWGDGQWAYDRLDLALSRLLGVVIQSKNSFWDHKGKSFATHSFGILSAYMVFSRADRADDNPYVSCATFNEVLFESFKSGFIKTLDLDLYLSLRSPVARKLFRILDKRLHRGPRCDFEVMRLAQRIALSDSAYPSDVKKHLDNAHDELFSIGFLKSARFAKQRKSLSVSYEIAPRPDWQGRTSRPKMPVAQPDHPLLRELVRHGVTRRVAQDLLDHHGEKAIADKLEVFETLLQQSSPLVTKNPAGFLRQSIEKDFAPPAGYVSRMVRKQREAEEAAQRRQAEALAEREAEEAEQHRARMDALWDALPSTDRSVIEEQALAALSPFAIKRYQEEQAAGRTSIGYETWRVERDKLLANHLRAHQSSMPADNSAAPERDLA